MLTNDQLDIRFDAVGGGHAARSEIHIDAGHAASVAVPDAHLLFSGEYHRVGSDLQISDSDLRLTIHDYFRAERRPSLVAPNGATLADDVVAALATSDIGERYAQVGAGAAAAQIGRVETMTGSASAVRNGVSVELHPGDPVLKGDAVQTGTGSSLGISFIDGTIFSLSASARMVLNDMVYQAGGTGNSAALTLVQGSIGFLAGQVAKTGNMQVGTPVATMGIRGTLVFTENPPAPTGNTITSVDGVVSFSIGRESDGRVGTYQVTPLSGPSLTVNDPSLITYVTPGGSVSQDSKPDVVLQAEILLTQQIYQIASLAQANQPGVPNSGPQGGGGGGSSTPPDINGAGNPSNTPGGTGNGQPTNPGGHDIQTPNFSLDLAPPQTSAPPTTPLGPSAPAIPGTPSGTTGTGQPSDTGGGQGATTPNTPPPLASQTVPLGQNQGVAVTTQRAGLLYSGGADAATVAAEHVSFVERGTQDNANHVAVDAGSSGTSVAGDFGTLTIHQDGTYSYASLRSTSLAEGEVGLDQFTYTVVNASGQSSLATLTFRITGANDAPTPVNDTAAAAGDRTIAATSRATGLLGNDTDPDHNETATLHITGVSAATGSGTTTAAVAATGSTSIHGRYGTLMVASDGTYSYTQDGTSPLVAGQVGTETFTYTVQDSHGASDSGSASGTFTIQVTGAGPFLDLNTADGSRQTSYVSTYAGAGTAATSPNVAITDPDSPTLTSTTISVRQGGNIDTQDTLSIDSGTLSTDHLLFSGSSGTYTLTTAFGQTATAANYADALAHLEITAGSTTSARDVTLSIVANDGTHQGNTATSTIHIVPTSFSGADTGSVVEASSGNNPDPGMPTSTGTLHDGLGNGETDQFQPVSSPATSDGGYGSYTVTDSGTWSYTLDNSNGSVNALGSGQHLTDTFELVASDGSQHAVTIDISGANDAPTTADDTNAITVGSAAVTGNVLSNDVDPEGDAFSVTNVINDASASGTFTVDGEYGRLVVTSNGAYSYELGATTAEQSADAALAQDQTATDKFTYTATDVPGASENGVLRITVTGVNDPPALDLDSSDGAVATGYGTSYAGGGTHIASGNVSLTDPDAGATVGHVTLQFDSASFHNGDALALDGSVSGFTLTQTDTETYFLQASDGQAVTDAQAAAVIQTVIFSAGDTATNRTVGVSVVAYDGHTDGNVAHATIAITPDQAPTIDLDTASAGDDYATSYVGTDTAITGAVSVTDPDGTTLDHATLTLTGSEGGDTLRLDEASGFMLTGSGSYYVLSTSDGSPAADGDFAAALQDLRFVAGDTSTDRTVTVSVTVNDGMLDSQAAQSSITITHDHFITTTHDSDDSATSYTAQNDPVLIDTGLTVTDAIGLTNGTVTLSQGDPEDVLSIQQSDAFDLATGSGTYTLTFSDGDTIQVDASNPQSLMFYGSATAADYQAAYEAVGFSTSSTSDDTRVVTFELTDTSSETFRASDEIAVAQPPPASNAAPVVTTTDTVASYILNGSAVRIDPNIAISDPDSGTLLYGATIQDRLASGGAPDGDTLSIPDGNYTGFSVASGTLTFSDNDVINQSNSGGQLLLTSSSGATVADFQAALREIRFSATTDVVDTRFVDFTVNDGTSDSAVATDRAVVSDASPTAADGFFVTYGTPHSGQLPPITGGVSGTFYVAEAPEHGTLSYDSASGTYTYTQQSGYTGSDQFIYRAEDGNGDAHAYTVTIGDNPAEGVAYGSAILALGDVDGDGNSDQAAGAPGTTGSGGFVFLPDYTPGSGEFGHALASVGDLNGDGVAEVAIGAPLLEYGSGTFGAVYIYHPGTGDTASLDFEIHGANDGDQAGYSVAGAGYFGGGADASGAQLPDTVLGAPGANSAYVVFGTASTDDVYLNNLTGHGIAIHDDVSGDQFGYAVAGGGDYAPVGSATIHYSDVIIGAPGTPDASGNADAGAVYIVHGSANPANVDVSGTFDGFKITGLHAGDEFGHAVANLGDINGDGIDDFAVGAPGAANPNGDAGAGAVYVIYGHQGLTSVDLNQIAQDSGGYVLYGEHAGDHFGSSVATAGDVDGDGLADFLIGAPTSSNHERIDNGAAYLVRGEAADGTSGDGPSSGTVPTSDMVLTGDRAGDELGVTVAGLGDVDGSGLTAFAAGAPHAYNSSTNTLDDGYYESTSASGSKVTIAGTSAGETLTGTSAADHIDGMQGNDRIVGGGGGDNLIGGSGQDTFVFSSLANDAPGQDTIADFHAALTTPIAAQRDVIEIDGYGLFQFQDVQTHLSAPNSHDTLITFDDTHSVLLKNVSLSSLTADDFAFHAASA